MANISFGSQLHNNLVSLISLIVAIVALSYTGWRFEVTEKNQNLRFAAFEGLKQLGELQIVLNANYYADNSKEENTLIRGWLYISLLSDLSHLLPSPASEKIETLIATWKTNWKTLKTNEENLDLVTNNIDASRGALVDVLKNLK